MAAGDLTLIALVTFGLNLVSGSLGRRYITLPLVFTAAGLILGPEVIDLLEAPPDASVIEVLAEATLVLVLFSDASRIDIALLRHEASLPARLLLIALPLTIAAGVGVGVLLWGEADIWEIALIAALLAPTDAALGKAVVANPAVPVRIRTTLNVESGLNDGLAAPVVTLFIALVAAESEIDGSTEWIRFAGEQIGFGVIIGLAVGVIGGYLVDWTSRHQTGEGGSRRLAALALAVTAAAGSTAVGGNPFIAAFVAGAALRRVAPASCNRLYQFLDREGELFAQLTFLIFGAALVGIALQSLTLAAVVYALLSLTVLRMVPVALSLIGAGLRPDTIAFLGWFGPRGLASIVFILTAIDETDLTADDELVAAACITVVLSIVAHGFSAQPLSTLYGRRLREAEEEPMEEMEHWEELPVRGIGSHSTGTSFTEPT